MRNYDLRLTADAWRKRARRLRAIADTVENFTAKEALLLQSQQWDRMAEESEHFAMLHHSVT